MATPAKNRPLKLVTPADGDREAGAGELVPVAFLGRTSTADMQDPRASLSRQLRAARAWLPPGWFLVAYYWMSSPAGWTWRPAAAGRRGGRSPARPCPATAA
jgi:hypothetical protein